MQRKRPTLPRKQMLPETGDDVGVRPMRTSLGLPEDLSIHAAPCCFQHLAFVIDSASEVAAFAVDLDDHLIDTPEPGQK